MKFCKCGCGGLAPIAKQTYRKIGHIKGQPCRFILGHQLKTHGLANKAIYNVWVKMIARCSDPKNNRYERYGGRGITICKRWLTLKYFHEDMGDPPAGTMLDRIDNNGNYEPGNCRWATRKEQARNTSRNHLITYDNMTLTMAEWGEKMAIPYDCLKQRINKLEWSPEKALTKGGVRL